jgi:hypothetical protein
MWEDKRLRDITEADVRQIVDSGLEEHLQLEYKSALYDNNHQGSKESLLDICMFANAGGGILLIGISEQREANGQPTGIPDPNADLGIDLLRRWRAVRHLSQLDLSLDAEISTRHLSCVETGCAQPGCS